MNELERCCVQLVWTGPTQSMSFYYHLLHLLISHRIKEKLHSGEMAVSGDQWPIFLYHGYTYDPEDPWNGLFQSNILVLVSVSCLRF